MRSARELLMRALRIVEDALDAAHGLIGNADDKALEAMA